MRNVLIIGLGSIAKKHILVLNKLIPEVKIFALRSSLNADVVDGVENLYSYDEISSFNFEFAIISNNTAAHKDTIERLIPFKIPLFIEKPLFNSLGNENLIETIEKENIKNYVACNLRFLESLQFAKKFIVNKRINEVNIYCGSYLPDWRPTQNFREVYSAHADMGGGVHLDLIHEMDYVYWFFKKPQSIYANFEQNSSLQINAVDYAHYLLRYDNFAVAMTLNYYRRIPKRSMEILCEDGLLEIDLIKNTVTWNQELIFRSEQTIAETYKAQLEFFIKNVVDDNMVFNDTKEAYEILKLCLNQN